MPANPRICCAVSYMRSPPGAPPACSRAPALPIPTAPDRPETSADTLLKVALSFAPTFAPTLAQTLAPAPTPAPPPSCRPPKSLHNTVPSALGSPQGPPPMPDLGVTPVICRDHQSFQFFTASGKLGQDAILTGKP